MPTPSVSELFVNAGSRLRVDFQTTRESGFHAGQTGTEVEDILRRFLNEHIPQRYRAASAFLIDSDNAASKQCDVAIYDAINSPVLRSTAVQQILPVDHVAAVIEVKSSLNKDELADAYEKVASCKGLKKTPRSSMDMAATGSTLVTIRTMGIVFAFDSATSLDTLAENAKELNAQYDSSLWPDLICVLDKGSITYMQQFAQGEIPIGMLMVADGEFAIPPAYVILSVLRDGASTLNRFMALLLSQLTFFAHRPSSLRFDRLLDGASNEFMAVQGYMYDTKRQRQVVSPDRDGKDGPPAAEIRVRQKDGKDIGQLAYFTWRDGGYVLGRGQPPLPFILSMLFPGEFIHVFPAGDAVFSSILALTRTQFLEWSARLPSFPPLARLNFDPIA